MALAITTISFVLVSSVIYIIGLRLLRDTSEIFKQLAFDIIEIKAAWVTHLIDTRKQEMVLEQTEHGMLYDREKAQLMLIEHRKRLLDVSRSNQSLTTTNRGPSY